MTDPISWAQHGEDVLVHRHFRGRAGVYVEVGAHDGITFSNTYLLEQSGWTGICVEAHPANGAQLEVNRPGADVVRAACVGEPRGTTQFHVEPNGLLSGLAPLEEAEIARRYRRRGVEFHGLEVVEVPTTTLDQILRDRDLHPADVDVMSIDVEGTELDVLDGLTLDDGGPSLLIVEANDRAHARRLRSYLRDHGGYAFAGSLGVNAVFSRPSDVSRLRALRVRCHATHDATSRTIRLARGLPRRSTGLVVRQLVDRLRSAATT